MFVDSELSMLAVGCCNLLQNVVLMTNWLSLKLFSVLVVFMKCNLHFVTAFMHRFYSLLYIRALLTFLKCTAARFKAIIFSSCNHVVFLFFCFIVLAWRFNTMSSWKEIRNDLKEQAILTAYLFVKNYKVIFKQFDSHPSTVIKIIQEWKTFRSATLIS